MQQPSPWSRGSLVFGIVAVVALGSTVVATGIGGGAERHFASARSKMRGECMDVGKTSYSLPGLGNPCDVTAHPPVLAEATRRRRGLVAADGSLRKGERGVAAMQLADVLDGADVIDRMHTLSASVAAASLIDGVADRIDADPALLDQPYLVSALRRTSFVSSKHPLTTERLHALSRLSHVPGEIPLPTTLGFAEGRATRAMGDVDVALHRMENATLAKDTAGCQTAATSTTGLAALVTVGPGVCPMAGHVVASGERLAALRARAATHASLSRSPTFRL